MARLSDWMGWHGRIGPPGSATECRLEMVELITTRPAWLCWKFQRLCTLCWSLPFALSEPLWLAFFAVHFSSIVTDVSPATTVCLYVFRPFSGLFVVISFYFKLFSVNFLFLSACGRLKLGCPSVLLGGRFYIYRSNRYTARQRICWTSETLYFSTASDARMVSLDVRIAILERRC